MEENREFLARRRAEEEAAAVCALSEEERVLRRELAQYYAGRLAQFTSIETNPPITIVWTDADMADTYPPRSYYFHVRNGHGFVRDEEGQMVSPDKSVRQIAIDGARSVMAADILDGFLDLSGQIEVADDENATILTLRFGDAIIMK